MLPTTTVRRKVGTSTSTLKAAKALEAMKGELAEVARDTAASLSSLKLSVSNLEKEREDSSKEGDEGLGIRDGQSLASLGGGKPRKQFGRGSTTRSHEERVNSRGGELRRAYKRMGEEEGRRWEQRREVRRQEQGMEKKREEMRRVQQQLETLLHTADTAIATRLAEQRRRQAPTMGRGTEDRHLARTKRAMETSLRGLLNKVDSAIEEKEARMGRGAARKSRAQMLIGVSKIAAIEGDKGKSESKISRIEAVKNGADAQLDSLLKRVDDAMIAQKDEVHKATVPGRIIFRTR